MDSFFEQPRATPIPLSRKEISTVPEVPEVSMEFHNNAAAHSNNDSMYLTYKTWKARNENAGSAKTVPKQSSKIVPTYSFSSESFATKQVRFQGESNRFLTAPSPKVDTFEPRFKSKPFEQIQMAHIPDRHLDLSLFDSPKKLRPMERNLSPKVESNKCCSPNPYLQNFENRNSNNKENTTEDFVVKKIRDTYGDDPLAKNKVIDMYNYKRGQDAQKLPYIFRHHFDTVKPKENLNFFSDEPTKCEIGTQTENSANDDLMVKDLLNIIQQQNQQLLNLQQQFSMLLKNNEQQQNQIKNSDSLPKGYSATVESQQFSICQNIPRFGLQSTQQYSVAVAITRQQNLNQMGKETAAQTPRLCEVIEEESSKNILADIPKVYERNGATSDNGLYTIEGSVHVQQPCLSPENSINLDSLEEYNDDEEDTPNSDRSFIEGQVNHILKEKGINPNTTIYPEKHLKKSGNPSVDKLMQRVLETTLKRLNKLGVDVSVDDSNSNDRIHEPKNQPEVNLSLIVEQILMKILPDDQLAKLSDKQVKKFSSPVKRKQNHLISRPEFSIKSMKYLRKYNLLPDSSVYQNTMQNEATPKRRDCETVKFLDDLKQLSYLPNIEN